MSPSVRYPVVFIVSLLMVYQDVLCYEDDGFFSRLLTSGGHYFETALQNRKVPCTCGIFLESQVQDDKSLPESDPAYISEFLIPMLPCGYRGNKLCQDKCLDEIIPHIHQIGPLMCSAIEKNCFRERASLFIKNCDDIWTPSGLTLGREFCCFDGIQTRCPRNWFGETKSQLSTMSASVISEMLEPPPKNLRSVPEVILDISERAVDLVTKVFKTKN